MCEMYVCTCSFYVGICVCIDVHPSKGVGSGFFCEKLTCKSVWFATTKKENNKNCKNKNNNNNKRNNKSQQQQGNKIANYCKAMNLKVKKNSQGKSLG